MICPRAGAAALTALLAVLCGCVDDELTEPDLVVPTAIVVDPVAFPGIPCSDTPGALQSYVATLVDRTDPAAPFVLPSSGPIPCSQKAQFRFVGPGRAYSAEIDGYEHAARALVPRGGDGSGNRQMRLGSITEDNDNWASLPVASPRWMIACSERTVQEGASLSLETCELVEDRGTTAVTAIEVDPMGALGNLRCESEGGRITAFDVLPVDSSLPPVLGIPCPPPSPIRYEVGISPGTSYDFRIEATGTDALYGASCQVETQEQITVAAACAPLSSGGALRIPIDAVLAATGLTCGPEGLSSYVVGLESQSVIPTIEPLASSAIPCDENARFAPLPPGPYLAEVREPGAPSSAPLATCQGQVIPGATTVATCAAAP